MDEKKIRESFKGVKKDISDLRDGQIKIVDSIKDLTKKIDEDKKLKEESINRLTKPINRLMPINISTENLKYDGFSEQEKKIIRMFLQHKDMALSYKDLSKLLNKSANTIKFQMRVIANKSDVFDKVIGEDNRNRFRLKQGLKIERQIN